MGFPGHCKIAGHSGTDFKHRKAFSKIKSYQKQSNLKNSSSESGEFILPIIASDPMDYQQAYAQDRKIRLFFKLPVFLITIMLIGFVAAKYSNHYKDSLNARNHQNLIDLTSYKTSKALEHRTFFNNSGYYHLRIGDLFTAQREFTQAIFMDEYDIDARIGLTETLIERCIQHHEVCEEATANLAFLDNMDYLTKEGIWALGRKLEVAHFEKKANNTSDNPHLTQIK